MFSETTDEPLQHQLPPLLHDDAECFDFPSRLFPCFPRRRERIAGETGEFCFKQK